MLKTNQQRLDHHAAAMISEVSAFVWKRMGCAQSPQAYVSIATRLLAIFSDMSHINTPDVSDIYHFGVERWPW